MHPEIETKQVTAVQAAVQSVYDLIFPEGDREFVSRVFEWASDCFNGNYRDYLPIDARYHDFEHTLQGALCLARLLQGYHAAEARPPLTQRIFELSIIAILLHDTGYLKRRHDTEGTGAKYTLVHVSRSVALAGNLLEEKGFSEEDVKAVQNMIRCTGVNVNLGIIPFQCHLERFAGFALGTSDLLGQMAARDYIDKLPILYEEFEESAQYNAGRGAATGTFKSAHDLMERTPAFWEKFVYPKLCNDFAGMFLFLNSPYPDGENIYIKRIEGNLARLKFKLAEGLV